MKSLDYAAQQLHLFSRFILSSPLHLTPNWKSSLYPKLFLQPKMVHFQRCLEAAWVQMQMHRQLAYQATPTTQTRSFQQKTATAKLATRSCS